MKRNRASPIEIKYEAADGEEEQEVDLIQMLEKKARSTINMKELPPKNKKGKVVLFGYMDDFFNERAPVPATNLVVDNLSLDVIKDLTGEA